MSFQVQVDWDKDGFISADDVTGDVTTSPGQRGVPVQLSYGRDLSSPLAPTVAGRGSFRLVNQHRRYSPRNTLSPLYGQIKPARPVRIGRTAGDSYSGTYSDTYVGVSSVLFVGNTDDSPINPDVESKTVDLTLVDGLAYFRGVNISTSVYSGIRTGEAIEAILDACGWPGDLRDIDSGATVISWWWEDNDDALTALDKVVRSEGSPALLTMGTSGEVIFRDRHHRFLRSEAITSQATWNVEGGAEPVMNVPFSYDDAWRNIINHGLISVDVRNTAAVDVVWELDSPVGFSGGEIKTFIASSTDPFRNAIVPIAGTDFNVTFGSLASVTLSRTSGASTSITLTAAGGGAQIDRLQLRAQPFTIAYTVQVAASDVTSISDYGQRSFPNDLPWCNQFDAQAILNTAVQQRANPLPVLSVTFLVGSSVDRAEAILLRNLSERVTVVETETVLNDDFYIESIDHEFSGEKDHTVGFQAEAVPPDGEVTAANIFIIGSSTSGHRIGSGLLAP